MAKKETMAGLRRAVAETQQACVQRLAEVGRDAEASVALARRMIGEREATIEKLRADHSASSGERMALKQERDFLRGIVAQLSHPGMVSE